MAITSDEHLELIRQAIRTELKARVDAAIEEEIKATAERINKRIRASADIIALNILEYYNMRRDGQDIVIRVSKPEKEGR
jgi:hypothetical protein